jgi:hypothetical protein
MRKLTEIEQKNATYLSEQDIEFSFLLPTSTGLGKSIMDAVSPLRDYLFQKGIHDYTEQAQGPDNKVFLDAVVVGERGVCSSMASLYRPNTKKGDSRIWFSHLKSQVAPNEMLAIIAREKILYVLNLTSSSYRKRTSTDKEFASIISELRPTREIGGVASELLAKMQKISRAGFIPAECAGDTAIGRTLESALGLMMNSSPLPDYKGIELKSKRRKSNTRKTLFAKVPDWDISSLSSFREFLEAYGYEKNGLRRLNCTVSALQRNPQGLKLAVDYSFNLLLESGKKEGKLNRNILVWKLSALGEKLTEKHKETFWVSAETRSVAGREEFLFKSIEYTRSPYVYQFPDLLAAGFITVDHLVKEKGASAHERGPLFKVNKSGFKLLFPAPQQFDLG